MGSTQLGRDLVLTIDTKRIATNPEGSTRVDDKGKPTATPSTMTPLHVEFNIVKTETSEPNKAEITIYNMVRTLKDSSSSKDKRIVIEAGYSDDRTVIFTGDIETEQNSREGVTWVTKIQAGDGAKSARESRVNASFKPGTKLAQALKEVSECMKVGTGNSLKKFEEGGFRKGASEFIKGFSMSGKCTDVMDKLAKTAGLEWTIQDDKLQVLLKNKGQTVQGDAVLISKSTGMIGSPEAGDKGVVTAKVLLNGRIWPGRKLKIDSALVKGFFRAGQVKHEGSNFGNAWYTTVEAKPL